MKYVWCSQEVAVRCGDTVPHRHVAIASPGGRRITPPCGAETLHLFFHDLDPEAIKRSERMASAVHPDAKAKGEELIANCFTASQAKEIFAFLSVGGLSGAIINCEAGISRSAGVVLAYRRKFGGDTEELFRKAWPNLHVASLMAKALSVDPVFHSPPPSEDFFKGPIFS